MVTAPPLWPFTSPNGLLPAWGLCKPVCLVIASPVGRHHHGLARTLRHCLRVMTVKWTVHEAYTVDDDCLVQQADGMELVLSRAYALDGAELACINLENAELDA